MLWFQDQENIFGVYMARCGSAHLYLIPAFRRQVYVDIFKMEGSPHSDFQTRVKSLNPYSHITEEKIGNASKLACEQVHTFHISQVISHNQTQFTYKIDTRPLPVFLVT